MVRYFRKGFFANFPSDRCIKSNDWERATIIIQNDWLHLYFLLPLLKTTSLDFVHSRRIATNNMAVIKTWQKWANLLHNQTKTSIRFLLFYTPAGRKNKLYNIKMWTAGILFYYLGFSDYCLHLHCYFHNVSADMSSGLLQWFVELGNLHRTSNNVLQEPQPQCLTCQTTCMDKHILIECRSFAVIRKRFFKVNNLTDLFENVKIDDILSFLRETELYQKIWQIKTG